jgi:CBS domain-containing protein
MTTTAVRTAAPPLTIRDIMSRDVVTLSPDMTLREAIEVLDQRHISGAPVVAGGAVVGILSVSDVLALEVASPTVPVAHPERPEQGELETPEEWVEGAEAPSAYFTDLWDDAGVDVVERIRQAEGPEWDVLAEHTVGEAMTAGVRCVRADASLKEAAGYMLDQTIHRAIVLDGDTFAGLVTTTDFLRAVAGRGKRGRP